MTDPKPKSIVSTSPDDRSPRSTKRLKEREKKAEALRSKANGPAAEMPTDQNLERTLLTPELAVQLIEHNTLNRPISDQHVSRIAKQIIEGKWKFNGDTIKISDNQQVLDGQHRCWAVIEAQVAIDTIIVYGIAPEAFSTIDTIRRLRSGGDTISLAGVRRYRNPIATALAWLIRYQRGVIENHLMAENRIENSDIEATFAAHPGVARAVERAYKARSVANPGITGCMYYVMHNHNEEIAEAFMRALIDPSGLSVNNPFFRLRAYFLSEDHRKESVVSIALIIKAANATRQGREVQLLTWRSQGINPEPFPVLAID